MKTVQENHQFPQQYQPLPRLTFESAEDFMICQIQATGEKQQSL
jgi:hypothetical protein